MNNFFSFMTTYGKKYKSDEEFLSRFQIFKENLKIIAEKNEKYGATTQYAVNKFADLSKSEFKELYLMKNLPPYVEGELLNVTFDGVAPTTFDWRTKGAITGIKDQGQCGSCWAFSATENIESVYKIQKNTLPILGPQQIVDCDKTDYGCSGGWPHAAFTYVIKQGGQDTEATYPYTARDGTCKFKTAGIGAKISAYKSVAKDETTILNGLVSTAPFSVCVDAESWSFYSGGVMTPSQCGRSVDHCVQLIGYDQTKTPGYWIVRNSWGTDWGLQGLIYLQLGGDTCLINDYVTTTTAA